MLEQAAQRAEGLAVAAYEALRYAKERGWSSTAIEIEHRNRLKQVRLIRELMATEDVGDLF